MASATAKRSVIDTQTDFGNQRTPNGFAAVNWLVPGGLGAIYIHAPVPCPMGCTVVSAVLRLRQAAAGPGNRPINIRRALSAWREETLTWQNKPAAAGGAATASVAVNGAGSTGRVIDLDVTADVQKFVDGAAVNWGWRIDSDGASGTTAATIIAFFASEAADMQPELIVEWSDNPETPTDEIPTGGAVVATPQPPLRWSFVDLGGDTTMAGFQVHVKQAASAPAWSATAGFSSPGFDSGNVTSPQPQMDLAGTSFSAAPTTPVWWTVRHRDGAGLWSTWSDPQSFVYLAQQSVTLDAPGAVVTDTTFPWAWDASTQSRVQLLVVDASMNVLWEKTLSESATRSYTTPRGVVRAPGATYTAILRVWDDQVGRQDVPGYPAYVEVTREFSYEDDPDVDGVTSLEYAPMGPGVRISWRRSEMPDQFAVWVDGVEQVADSAAVFHEGGSEYGYDLLRLAPRVPHEISVKAIRVDGGESKTSSENPTITVTSNPLGVWLIVDYDLDESVPLLQDSGAEIVSTEMPEVTESYNPVGSSRSVQVTSALRWFEGSVTEGVLADHGDLTALDLRARMLAIKENRLRTYVLQWGTHSVPVYISNVNVFWVDIPGEHRWKVSFDFVAAVPSPEYVLR